MRIERGGVGDLGIRVGEGLREEVIGGGILVVGEEINMVNMVYMGRESEVGE